MTDDPERELAQASFLAVMSHEFRTPLTTILGMMQVLESTPLDPEQRRYLESAERAGRNLFALIDNVLRYASLEARQVTLAPEAFDLAEELETCADIMRLGAQEKGVKLVADVDAALAGPRHGDANWLRQGVINLLDNAVKFTAEGEVRLTARAEGGEAVRVTVSDTGVALSTEDASTVFDVFSGGDDTGTRRYGGAGLGLASARRIVELMGGSLDARPGEKGGAAFEFVLMLPGAAEAEAVAPVDPASKQEPRRILVAEDNPVNQKLIRVMLERLGHDVEVVDNGAKVVEAVTNGPFDLVVMDVHMPVMDGLTAARAIRALNNERAGTPILALTADVRPEVEERVRQAGMNAFLEKPIDVTGLSRAVQDLTAGGVSRSA